MKATINFDDFAKIEMTVGKILTAEKIPETDKLLKLTVSFGGVVKEDGTTAEEVRQIVSGISMHFPNPHALVGTKCMFVTNLEPRKIKGFESQGMILALSTEDGKFSLLKPSEDIPEGTRAK